MPEQFEAVGDPFSIQSPIVFDVPPPKETIQDAKKQALLENQKAFVLHGGGVYTGTYIEMPINGSIWITSISISFYYEWISGTVPAGIEVTKNSASGTKRQQILKTLKVADGQGDPAVTGKVGSETKHFTFNPPIQLKLDNPGDVLRVTGICSATSYLEWFATVNGYQELIE